MNKDIYYKPCGNGYASQNREKWLAESHLYQVRCIDNDFVAENSVRIQQRSIRGVLQRFFTENVWNVLESGTQTTQGSNYIFFRR